LSTSHRSPRWTIVIVITPPKPKLLPLGSKMVVWNRVSTDATPGASGVTSVLS
jgi:hypothetical protein